MAAKKKKAKRSEKKAALSPEASRAELRPKNFEDLSARDQWEVDKKLGILDWDGS